MSSVSLAARRPVLADLVVPRGIAADLALIVAGTALTALLAQVVIPLHPVPITGQTLAVLLGGTLGSLRGALSMVLYAVVGAVGLPVFSAATSGTGVLFGATGGYIVGFIFAAALTGYLAERRWDRRILGGMAAYLVGSLVPFAIGLPWLAITLGLSLEQTLAAGLYPFVLGGVIKAAIAAGAIRLGWFGLERRRS
jgi:biotin transport system substrate-specific component